MAETFSRGRRAWAERRSCTDFFGRGVALTGSVVTGSGATAEMLTARSGVESKEGGGAAGDPEVMHPLNPRRSKPNPRARLNRDHRSGRNAFIFRPVLHTNIRASLDHWPNLPRMSFFYLLIVTSK